MRGGFLDETPIASALAQCSICLAIYLFICVSLMLKSSSTFEKQAVSEREDVTRLGTERISRGQRLVAHGKLGVIVELNGERAPARAYGRLVGGWWVGGGWWVVWVVVGGVGGGRWWVGGKRWTGVGWMIG